MITAVASVFSFPLLLLLPPPKSSDIFLFNLEKNLIDAIDILLYFFIFCLAINDG
jgi:hypothetical protein